MRILTSLMWLLCVACWPAIADSPLRPVNTYSIVARDAETGELGVAVQSHWFAVGSVVAWAEPGVGAVATQSFADPSYGPLGLQLIRAGKNASRALRCIAQKRTKMQAPDKSPWWMLRVQSPIIRVTRQLPSIAIWPGTGFRCKRI
ncbi:MAG: DUF1028 domain-containing protein [Gammaproteobacteria bacterium]|nr:DUF1028 domain-containing protein [Gammaproteobacteria bacterium]